MCVRFEKKGSEKAVRGDFCLKPVFEISAILLRAGPDLGRKFSRAGPTWAENSSGPGRADSQKTSLTPKLVKNTLNWLQNPPKLVKCR